MYQCEKYRIKVYINLTNGLYVFVSTSATGKTYLCKILSQMNADGEDVMSYTYDDELRGGNLTELLNRKKYSVVLVDRYDLLNEKYLDVLRNYSKNAIVMLDYKSEVLDDTEPCDILLGISRIEVF